MSRALRFLQITAERQDRPFFYHIYNHKNFIPKHLNHALTDVTQNTGTSRQL